MTLFFQKHRHILTLAGAIFLASAVSACGENIDLSGAAGLGNSTDVSTTDVAVTEEAAVVVEEPTATPLPLQQVTSSSPPIAMVKQIYT